MFLVHAPETGLKGHFKLLINKDNCSYIRNKIGRGKFNLMKMDRSKISFDVMDKPNFILKQINTGDGLRKLNVGGRSAMVGHSHW